MRPFLHKNKLAYLILFAALAIFVTIFSVLWPNRQAQRLSALAFGVFYFIWGVSNHTKSKNLTAEIVFEYLAIAMLAILIMILITL